MEHGEKAAPFSRELRVFMCGLEEELRSMRRDAELKLIQQLSERYLKGKAECQPQELVEAIYGDGGAKQRRDATNIYPLRHKVNRTLREFSESAANDSGIHVSVSKSPYRLEVTGRRQEAESAEGREAFQKFWSPYLQNGAETTIVFTSPLFFRDAQYRYVRDIHVNNEQQKDKLGAVLGADNIAEWAPSRHYYSAGEVESVLKILSCLHEEGAHVRCRAIDSEDQLPERHDNHLIAIGSGRTNWYLDDQQAGLHFIVNQTHVEVEGSTITYSDGSDVHGRLIKHAVLTRRPSYHDGIAVTLIAANHGRAAEGVAEYLTTGRDLVDLVERLAGTGELPDKFQALFRVTLPARRTRELVTNVEVIAVWPGPAAGDRQAAAAR
ncbi:MAG: hypothetical protein HZB13_05930 [Acidobacteria bacterium]|nr:hypothetical protein [Acidobacteriota bacterium]